MIHEINLRPAQMRVFRSQKRFRVLVAGRRFGKTHLAMAEVLRAACGRDRIVWYVAPSYRQAKQIFWDRLKQFTRPFWGGTPSETELTIRLRWGAVIGLKGADHYDSLRGTGLDFVVLDEYASMKPECWTEVLRPALADKQGGALFIGTPQGWDHLYDRYEHARNDPDWDAFQFSTLDGGNVRAAELASASRELDERLFRQEFEASFEGTATGLAYPGFARDANVESCVYEPGQPLVWSLDFNVNPMCSVLAQTIDGTVQILDEMILENANTTAACQAFAERTAKWRGHLPITVRIYGDASGHQRRTSGVDTDWGLIREFFGMWRGQYEPHFRTTRSNPGVRNRVNAVNSRLLNAAGERRLVVDPKCRELIRDFEQVRWELDAAGRPTSELDKSDRKRTHISDALGYFIAEAFQMKPVAGERGDVRLF